MIFAYLQELDIVSLPENAEGQLSERNKRTIGVLRELFPELSKVYHFRTHWTSKPFV